MTKRKILMSLAIAAMLLPATAWAQDDDDFLLDEETVTEPVPVFDSWVEVGAGWTSDSSFKFGEFSGLEDKGGHIIGDFRIVMRAPWDGDSTEYWLLTGSSLGLESRALHLEFGHQGSFKLFLDYDQIPKFLLDDASTPFIISGDGTSLTLPANWVPGERNNGQMTNLVASLNDVNIAHDRKRFGGGVVWIMGKGWQFKSSFRREAKEGSRTIAAIFGTSGGNPASSIVPEPIDYETDDVDLVLGYQGKKAQLNLGYHLSVFRNANTSLTFQNPYTGSPWVPSASFPTGVGRIGLPPDSRSHQISLAGGYVLGPTTRATANFSYTRSTQNEDFLPFTIDPDIVITTPLPRSSLEGKVKTIMTRLGISSRPTPKLNLSAHYKYTDRDNETPRDVFLTIPSDSADQDTIDSSRARINLPYSRSQHLIEVEAGYRLTSRSKLTLAYDYEQFKRTFTEVAKTREHKFEAKLRTSASARLSGWMSFNYATRDGSEYIHNAAFLASHTPEHLGPDPEEEFENHPALRKFYIADRDQTGFKASATFLASDSVIISAMGRYSHSEYDATRVGLTDSRNLSATVDFSYNPDPKTTAFAFYTYENLQFDQAGFANRRGTDLTDFDAQFWLVDTRDKVNSFGVGIDRTAMEDRLEIGFEYIYSRSLTDFGFDAGTALSFLPLSDLKTRLHSLGMHAEYRYTDNMSIKLRYLYQKFDTVDFALDGIVVDTISTVIALGNTSPDYNVHVIGISTVYRF